MPPIALIPSFGGSLAAEGTELGPFGSFESEDDVDHRGFRAGDMEDASVLYSKTRRNKTRTFSEVGLSSNQFEIRLK